MTVRKALAVAMSFLGVVIVTSNGQLSGLAGGNLLGAGFCVLAALSYGLFVVLNKRLPYASSVSMMLYYIVSTLVAVTCVLVSGDLPELKGMQSLGLLWIGLGDYAIAYVSWALAMKAGQTAKIANLAYITPFLSLLVAHFVLGDPLTVWSIGGLAVIVAGIFLQLKDAK
jgi:drug/metabolite transporter (DMT)-like permease